VLGQVTAGVVEVDLDRGLVASRVLLLYCTGKSRSAHYSNYQGDGRGHEQPRPVAPFGPPDSQCCRPHLSAAAAR
jgi:hypothetical protein